MNELTQMPRDPEEFVDRLRERVHLEYKRMPYPITDRLFVVTRDGLAGTVDSQEKRGEA